MMDIVKVNTAAATETALWCADCAEEAEEDRVAEETRAALGRDSWFDWWRE